MFPVERQVEQFTYLIKELDKRPLSYINLVRYLGTFFPFQNLVTRLLICQ